MSDIRKLIDLLSESSVGATVSGNVATVEQAGFTQSRSTAVEASPVLEYGNWENSALSTSKKLKKTRTKASKLVKSIYGEDAIVKESKSDVVEMDNRTSQGDRREQRTNSSEAIAQREKQLQAKLKKVSPEMRKKLRLPDPKEGGAEGSGDKTAQQRKTERDKQRTAPAQKARNQAQQKGLQQDKDGTYYAKEGVAEGMVGNVVVHNYTKMPIELKPGQAQIHGWGPNDQPIYRVKGADGKEVITSNKKKMMIVAQGQGVAEAKSPAEFIGQMKKLISTEQQFNVGDWVTIDPNKTSGYASSGMTGRIVELYKHEGEQMAKINVGGGGGVQTKMKTYGGTFGPPGTTIGLGKGVRSYGTYTVVSTSILQKDDPQGVAEGLAEAIASGNYSVGLEDIGKRVTVNGDTGGKTGYVLVSIRYSPRGLDAEIVDRKNGSTGWYNLTDISKSNDQHLGEQGVAEAEPVPGKYSGHFYDAKILPNGDYEVVRINSKKDDNGNTNPLNLKVGSIVPKGKAHSLQYVNDGGMFDEINRKEMAAQQTGVAEGFLGNTFNKLKLLVLRALGKKTGASLRDNQAFQRMMNTVVAPLDTTKYKRLWLEYKNDPSFYVQLPKHDASQEELQLWADSLAQFVIYKFPKASNEAWGQVITALVEMAHGERGRPAFAKENEEQIDEVAGAQKCWPGHRKVGTQPGTGKNAGQPVNKCKKISKSK